jgi:hypothetical protein
VWSCASAISLPLPGRAVHWRKPACRTGTALVRTRKSSITPDGGGQGRPLPACPAGEAVRGLDGVRRSTLLCLGRPLPARPAGEAVQRLRGQQRGGLSPPEAALASELLHLPDEPAGVGQTRRDTFLLPLLAGELLHLPGEPAGVGPYSTIRGNQGNLLQPPCHPPTPEMPAAGGTRHGGWAGSADDPLRPPGSPPMIGAEALTTLKAELLQALVPQVLDVLTSAPPPVNHAQVPRCGRASASDFDVCSRRARCDSHLGHRGSTSMTRGILRPARGSDTSWSSSSATIAVTS